MNRPDLFSEALDETVTYLDLLDEVLLKASIKVNGQRLKSTGDQMQQDLRVLADRLRAIPELDARLMSLITDIEITVPVTDTSTPGAADE